MWFNTEAQVHKLIPCPTRGLGCVITACWAKLCSAVLDSKHLHSALVTDTINFRGGWVTTRVYPRVFTMFRVEQNFIPYILITVKLKFSKPRWEKSRWANGYRVLHLNMKYTSNWDFLINECRIRKEYLEIWSVLFTKEQYKELSLKIEAKTKLSDLGFIRTN